MLAYSVFSLRLSEDVPSQSDSVHLISLYLTTCMFFSLSAMTWFAIANKLRERKRLPYWLRWLALDYISWIVCATSMHRKAVRAAASNSKTSPISPSTPVTIPSQPTNSIDCSNPLYFDQDSSPNVTRGRAQQSLRPSSATIRYSNEATMTPTVWIRRPLSNIQSTTSNGPENKRMNYSFRKSRPSKDPSISKNQESLYAISIINRLVFLIFLSFVFVINIYTWFFYSRTVKTKLLDHQTLWTCFDEARLEVVNCNETI
jgi:hypothetical protein